MPDTHNNEASSEASSQPARKMIATRSVQWWQWLIAGVMLGILLLVGVRFATYHMDMTHYHANFAVYINGSRELFKDPKYYQEISICNLRGASPQARAHMHDQQSGLIHIHDQAVTWGQFFENLGWYIGPDFVRTPTTLYQADSGNKLNIVLNGQDLTDLTSITNQVIGDKDRLLVSYGPSGPAALQTQYKTVPSTAASYDAEEDPASCSGGETSSISERLHHLL